MAARPEPQPRAASSKVRRTTRRRRRGPAPSTQLPRILIRIYRAAAGLLATILLGTAGFYFGAGSEPSLSDALYMTLITITTVRRAEIVPVAAVAERLLAGMIATAGGVRVLRSLRQAPIAQDVIAPDPLGLTRGRARRKQTAGTLTESRAANSGAMRPERGERRRRGDGVHPNPIGRSAGRRQGSKLAACATACGMRSHEHE
jgi:hypothetical protein